MSEDTDLYVGKTSELESGRIIVAEGIDRVPVCILRSGDKIYALSGICNHKGAPLWEGRVKGEYLECPWHKANFKISTGKHSWPAFRDLRTFPVKVEEGSIYVKARASPGKRPASSK